jgi:membrane fusion protein (multidrug efflux system)
MLIPYKAVIEQMGEYFVFAVKENRAIQHRVTLGMNINDMVVVKDGLQPGDQIVTDGMQRLRENALVAVASAGMPPVSKPGYSK